MVWAWVGGREGRERVCWLHVVCMFVGVDVGVGGSGDCDMRERPTIKYTAKSKRGQFGLL